MSRKLRNRAHNVQSLRASLLMLGFGLSILALLIGIDRAHWFKMRPVSTGAAAMWHAADTHAKK